jgi:hypothetical protein
VGSLHWLHEGQVENKSGQGKLTILDRLEHTDKMLKETCSLALIPIIVVSLTQCLFCSAFCFLLQAQLLLLFKFVQTYFLTSLEPSYLSPIFAHLIKNYYL